jgi:hypothetical protein
MNGNRKRIGSCVFVSVVLVALMLAAVPASAQLPTGTILGVVKDSTGGTVGAAAVTVTNTDTGLTRTLMTSDDGAYRFPALPVGNYQVQVMKDGFQTAQRKGITLEVTQEAAIDFALQVGSTGQTVVVTEEAPLVNTTSSSTGGLVEEQQVADLPLNGRNLVDLTLMQSGITQTTVIPATTIGSGFMTGVTFSSNGAPIHSNSYMLDGANMLSTFGLNNSSIIGTTMGVDGIKEYKVVANLPSAEYGLSMGSQTTIVSKGGTNQFHGDAFDYLRNGSMDARNYFDALDTVNFNGFGTNKNLDFPNKRIPPFHRNNFGGAFGGPVKKDKLFFYAVYEALRQTWGQTIPTKTFPGGCFDQTVGSPTYHQITANSMTAPLVTTGTFNGQAITTGCGGAAITNPAVLYVLTGNGGANPIFPGQVGLFPFPNTNIDTSVLGDQFNNATFNYSFPYIQPTSENYGQARIDYNVSASDALFARFTQDDSNQIGNRSYAQQRDILFGAMQFITLSETHIFSPTVLNTARFSFSRNLTSGNSTTTSPITDPHVLTQPGQQMGGFSPGGGVTGFSQLAADGTYINNVYSYSDDVFWTKGKHAFKFGTLINKFRVPEDGHFNNRGSVSFSNFKNMDIGNFSTITTLGGTLFPSQKREFAYSTFGVYAQDDLRMTSRLTLNLGLRYEFNTVPSDTNGNNFQIQSILTANGKSATQGAVPGPWWINPSLHAFSPRIGFAWDPIGSGKTSLRGGAGLYYDIGNLGALAFQQACCEPPLDFFVTTNNAAATPPYAFNLPLPTAIGSGSGIEGVSASPPSPRNLQYHWNQTSMLQYNLTIDRQLPAGMGLTVGYVGTRGMHLVQLQEGNPTVVQGLLGNGLPYYCHPADAPTGPPTAADPCPSNSVFPARTNITYGQVNQDSAGADSHYNALQVGLTKRVTHGLQGQLSYTWSKLLDDGQGQQGVETGVAEATSALGYSYLDKGHGGFDVASNLRGNLIYHAPDVKSEKFYMKPLNGWWFGSIISMQSGYPINPTIAGRSLANNSMATDRPNLDPSFNPATVIEHSVTQWFNPTMFDVPVAGMLGNSPRYFLRGPSLKNVDFSVNKDTKVKWLGEQGAVQFRAEIFNIANRPNFGAPSSSLISLSTPAVAPCGGQIGTTVTCPGSATSTTFTPLSTAGNITSTSNRSRQVQLSLKVLF